MRRAWDEELAIVRDALTAAGIPVVPCGLNADWSVSAWCLTPGADPNRTDGAYYLLNDEDAPGEEHRYSVVRYWPSRLESEATEDSAYEWDPVASEPIASAIERYLRAARAAGGDA